MKTIDKKHLKITFTTWFLAYFNDSKNILHIGEGGVLYEIIEKEKNVTYIPHHLTGFEKKFEELNKKHFDVVSIPSSFLTELKDPKAYLVFDDILKLTDNVLLFSPVMGPTGIDILEESLLTELRKRNYTVWSVKSHFFLDRNLQNMYLITTTDEKEVGNKLQNIEQD